VRSCFSGVQVPPKRQLAILQLERSGHNQSIPSSSRRRGNASCSDDFPDTPATTKSISSLIAPQPSSLRHLFIGGRAAIDYPICIAKVTCGGLFSLEWPRLCRFFPFSPPDNFIARSSGSRRLLTRVIFLPVVSQSTVSPSYVNLTSPPAPRNILPSLFSRVLNRNQIDHDRQDHFSLSHSGKAGRRGYGSCLQDSYTR
jgi:hypothetical protein